MMAEGPDRVGRLGQALGSIAQGVACLVAGIVGWVVAFLAIAATVYAFSYLISGQWPVECAGLSRRTSVHPPGPLSIGAVPFVGLPGATALVGLWWVLGATSGRSRLLRLGVVVPLVLVAGQVGLLLLNSFEACA